MADFELVKRPERTVVVPESFDFDKHWPLGPNVLQEGDRIRVQVTLRRGGVNTSIADDVIVLRDYPGAESGNELVGRISIYLAPSPRIIAV